MPSLPFERSRPFESDALKARGNLSYLDFIRLVNKLWLDSHPDIPLYATGGKQFSKYPALTYRLDLRKPMDNESKPRLREEIRTTPEADAILIHAQRFQNVVVFTAWSQETPHLAEELVEAFEDFMIEYQPVFKELGASELVYLRRVPDSHDTRPGEEVVGRSVSYLLTTEKIIVSTVKKLQAISIDARTFVESDDVIFVANPDDATITIYGAVFSIGDGVYISGRRRPITSAGDHEEVNNELFNLPSTVPAGFYIISNVIVPPAGERTYTLSKVFHNAATPTYVPVDPITAGTGYIRPAIEGEVTLAIVDQYSQASPNH